MRHEITYGSFVVYFDGNGYVAETPPDEDNYLQLRSVLLQRIVGAIDDMEEAIAAIGWEGPRRNVLPTWLQSWCRGEEVSVNLDTMSRLTVLKIHGNRDIVSTNYDALVGRSGAPVIHLRDLP